jgi:hypothetical protein
VANECGRTVSREFEGERGKYIGLEQNCVGEKSNGDSTSMHDRVNSEMLQ